MWGKFDIRTAIITVIAVPIIYFLLRKLQKFLRQNLGNALDAILWTTGRLFQRSMARRVDFKRYCRIQLGKQSFRYLRVPGPADVKLETDEIFVPLTFETDTGESRSIRELAEAGNRIRIVGDPGSGKTSLTKRMFREACQEGLWQSRKRLPIAIELKSFIPPRNTVSESALAKWAMSELKKQVTDVQGFNMSELFDSSVTEYGLDVFLDGLDEVSSDAYKRVASAINGLNRLLANKSPHNRIYLTMRVQFHQQVHFDFDDDFPPVIRIKPFTPGDIYTFLTRWPFAKDISANITRIYGELTDRPTVREMCTNPLVLAMYVANDQDAATESSSADTRTAFYSQVVEELLVTRRSRQLGVAARSTLREQREAILGRLALENLSNPDSPANVVSWRRAVDILMATYNAKEEVAIARLEELQRDTGIISEERPGESLRFIHLTFCEYLAAKEYSQGKKDGWTELMASHREFASSGLPQLRTRLVEVIPFTVGLLTRSQRSDALNDVAKLGDQQILGRCLLETQLYDHDAWQVYWSTESKYLVNIDSGDSDQTAGEWLSRLHLFNVVLLDQSQWAAVYGKPIPISLGAVFSEIIEADRERLTKVFSSYATRDPAAAFRLAEATGVNLIVDEPYLVIVNLNNPPFIDIALERAQRQDNYIVEWALVFAAGAMTHTLAAAKLGSMAPKGAMAQRLNDINPKFKWYPFALPIFESAPGIMHRAHESLLLRLFLTRRRAGFSAPSPSLLTAALTLSTEAAMTESPDGLLVDIPFLRIIKPYGNLIPSWIFRFLAIIPIPFFYGMTGLAYAAGLQNNVAITVLAGILTGVGICGALALFAYPSQRLRFYHSLFLIARRPGSTYARLTGGVLVRIAFRKSFRLMYGEQPIPRVVTGAPSRKVEQA